MKGKTVAESRVTLAQIIEPTDANFIDKAFGGALLARIDLCAYATASKFAETIAVTASFDRVDFHEPIDVGELVTLEGTVTYVGRTSMEITIEIYADNLMQGTHRHTNTARVTMVALRDGKPAEVPHLICETREDKIAYLTGRTRRKRREVHLSELNDIIAEFESATDAELDALISG